MPPDESLLKAVDEERTLQPQLGDPNATLREDIGLVRVGEELVTPFLTSDTTNPLCKRSALFTMKANGDLRFDDAPLAKKFDDLFDKGITVANGISTGPEFIDAAAKMMHYLKGKGLIDDTGRQQIAAHIYDLQSNNKATEQQNLFIVLYETCLVTLDPSLKVSSEWEKISNIFISDMKPKDGSAPSVDSLGKVAHKIPHFQTQMLWLKQPIGDISKLLQTYMQDFIQNKKTQWAAQYKKISPQDKKQFFAKVILPEMIAEMSKYCELIEDKNHKKIARQIIKQMQVSSVGMTDINAFIKLFSVSTAKIIDYQPAASGYEWSRWISNSGTIDKSHLGPVMCYTIDASLPIADRVEMAMGLIKAITEYHEKDGLLHTDLKPANLKWDPVTRQVILIDHGTALHNGEKDIITAFSPRFAPSVKHMQGGATPHFDIFSVQVILRSLFGIDSLRSDAGSAFAFDPADPKLIKLHKELETIFGSDFITQITELLDATRDGAENNNDNCSLSDLQRKLGKILKPQQGQTLDIPTASQDSGLDIVYYVNRDTKTKKTENKGKMPVTIYLHKNNEKSILSEDNKKTMLKYQDLLIKKLQESPDKKLKKGTKIDLGFGRGKYTLPNSLELNNKGEIMVVSGVILGKGGFGEVKLAEPLNRKVGQGWMVRKNFSYANPAAQSQKTINTISDDCIHLITAGDNFEHMLGTMSLALSNMVSGTTAALSDFYEVYAGKELENLQQLELQDGGYAKIIFGDPAQTKSTDVYIALDSFGSKKDNDKDDIYGKFFEKFTQIDKKKQIEFTLNMVNVFFNKEKKQFSTIDSAILALKTSKFDPAVLSSESSTHLDTLINCLYVCAKSESGKSDIIGIKNRIPDAKQTLHLSQLDSIIVESSKQAAVKSGTGSGFIAVRGAPPASPQQATVAQDESSSKGNADHRKMNGSIY